MANLKCDKEITALLGIDPYNDLFPREAKYGVASRLLQKQMIVFLICCKS